MLENISSVCFWNQKRWRLEKKKEPNLAAQPDLFKYSGLGKWETRLTEEVEMTSEVGGTDLVSPPAN